MNELLFGAVTTAVAVGGLLAWCYHEIRRVERTIEERHPERGERPDIHLLHTHQILQESLGDLEEEFEVDGPDS